MQRMVEINSEVNGEAHTIGNLTFEILLFLGILLCLTLSARAQNTEMVQTAPQPTEAAQPQTQAPTRRILVSIPDRKLALLEDSQITKIYDIAVGASTSPTPNGEFQIVNRLVAPTYYHPGKIIGPGRENPLGTRWMGLSAPHLGIHGTNIPSSIGKAASHGCVRMRRKDLEELFALVQVGDVVQIRGERDDEIAGIFGGNTGAQPTEVAAVTAPADGQQ